jgi:hypothetical protein|tara:strand:+ start:201 stop:917 length:717 start_codon:yes stop_codon:yes gene_type:complete
MANPHFQNQILWAGNNVASKNRKNLPMFQPYPSDDNYYCYHNDFMVYTSGDWTITTAEDGSGSATEAIGNIAGGCLVLTNAAGDNDHDFLQLKGESFKLSSSKRAYFNARFKVSDATQSDFVMGLQITDTTPLAASDGVNFRKDDGDALLDFVVEKDSTETLTAGVATMADDTFIQVGFFLDPDSSQVSYFINNAEPVAVVNTNLPDNEELTVSFGIQNGEAAAKVMTIDYVNVMVER